MALDFPSSPSINDTYTNNGVEYIFDGTKWKLVSRSYSYTGSTLVNTNNAVSIDLSSGNFFTLDLSEQTTVSFTNPPSSGIAQKFYIKLGIVNTGYDLANASYDNVSFSVASQDDFPADVKIKSDGTKMYVVGRVSDFVYQYTLSTAWDLSTASYDSVSFSVASQDYIPTGVFFKSDGIKMYMVGYANDNVHQYTLSTPWDLSTASYDSVSFSVASQEDSSSGIFFKPDGTKMYIVGFDNDRVYQYTLSTAWDLSTASYDSVSFSVASQETVPRGIFFKDDGNKMYMIGSISDSVHQYTLSTPWDLSTASYDNISFSVTSQDTVPFSITFGEYGTKMYMVGTDTDNVFQYTTGTIPDVTWPVSIIWETGSAPVLPAPGETDVLEFYTYDGGTTYYAKLIEDDIS